MSPLNRGPLLGPRIPPVGIRPPPPPRFGGRLPPPGLPPRMPPPPMNPVFGPMRQRLPPPPRPGGLSRLNGPLPLFGPRVRGMAPMPPMGLRGAGPRGPLMRPWPRRPLPPQILSHMRPRFSVGNGNNVKSKALNNVKKVNKLEELELKKPWMTDEIRTEIQKKNKLYAKAKKNKDAKEWEEFKDLRNKVTRMIRDAKNDYLTKHPEQGGQKRDDKNTNESEGVQKTDNATEQSVQKEVAEETQPSSEQAALYSNEDEPYDQRDENYASSEDDVSYYCEVCDRDFPSEDSLSDHKKQHRLCGIDGCTFSAHSLLVEKHISMQHSSGLYHRMKNLSTPEDIKNWLIERKKKYPTKANIELHKAKELEKIQRGEVIKEQKRDVRKQRRKKSNAHGRKRVLQKRSDHKLVDVTQEAKEAYRGLLAFSGTISLREVNSPKKEDIDDTIIADTEREDINHISDEEDIPIARSEPVLPNSCVLSLVANYESDSEESEGPEEVPIKKVKVVDDEQKTIKEEVIENAVVNATQLHTNIQDSSNSQSSTQSTTSNTDLKCKNKKSTEFSRSLKENYQQTIRNRKAPRRSQLLQKLLSRSIQHERNLICQCVKYIAENNFFD